MSELTFNFCGIYAEELSLTVNDIRRAVVPEITENVQNIPGMVGELFLGNSYGKLIFEIDVTLKANDARDRAEKLHDLANLFMTFGDGEWPMIFSNDAEYTYYGHFTNISMPQKFLEGHPWVKFTLTFACSDPKGYGEYESYDITENPILITPNGTAECYPIFTCIPKKDITKIAITDEEGNYVFIGADVDPDTGDEPINKEPLVFHDPCNTLATWTTVTQSSLTFNLENGVIGGSMKSTPNTLRPSNFGSPVKGKWHGPVIMQWLPSSYSDYRIRVRMFTNQYYPRAQGKIELYLLDSNGSRIGKFMLKDNGTESKVVFAQVQVGYDSNGTHHDIYYGAGTIKNGKKQTVTIKVKNGTKKVTSNGKTKTVQLWKTVQLDEDLDTSTFTDFYGYLELQKIGNKFRIAIMKLDDKGNPAWDKPIVRTWTDTQNQFNKALAGIALYTAKYDITEDTVDPVVNYRNNEMGLCDVQVWNIIDGGNGASSTPTVIAHAGDEIKINCEDHTVYKNGDFFMKNFYIGSNFPKMQGGVPKTFAFDPNLDDADWYYEYRSTVK